jgi:hypothetical protein
MGLKHIKLIILFSCVTGLLLLSACKKDQFITSAAAKIETNTDTLKFDTVFTSVGSVTQFFKINNPNSQKLKLSTVKLMGGTASPFTININGIAAAEATNIEVAAKDSLYIFVTVKINPNLNNLPFIVRDSVQIAFNGNQKFVQLEAFGQNANFLRNQVIRTNRVFNSSLPYVILDGLRVDTNVTLTLPPGCRIYAANNSPILVDGTLIARGTAAQPISFAGDRLDADYRDLPASWPGIYFRGSSKNNVLQFAQIKNAYQAVVSESAADNALPKVLMQQCIIDNAYDAGIYCVNSTLQANNCLISNCGRNIQLDLGGSYQFINCTAASYSVYVSHTKPVLNINNAALIGGTTFVADLDARFTNCIFWAENSIVKDEVAITKSVATGNSIYQVQFNNCIYKADTEPSNAQWLQSLRNADPLFDSIDLRRRIFDFRTSATAAPGVNKGIPTPFNTDLLGNPRNNGLTDIGCYEQ